VVSGAALQRAAANNIGETLTSLPGLANASFGQNVGRPVIRGLQGQRVGVLANNMAAGDAAAVSQDHAVAVEPFLADQIEVLRGPSTLLYGSGAIGGVINVVTHTIPQDVPENGPSGRVMAQLDSAANQRFVAGRIDLGSGRFAMHADAFYRRSDDYEIPGKAELYPEDDDEDPDHEEAAGILENSFLDNQGGALGGSWLGDHWRFGLSWTGYQSDYGIPGAVHHEEHGHGHDEEHGEEAGEGDAGEQVTIGLESDRVDAELVGSDPFAGFGQLRFKFAATDYSHTEYEGSEIGTVFDSQTRDARLELRHDRWGRWSGAFGVQYTDVDFSAVGEEAFVPPSRSKTAALFWIESAEFEQWQLELGVRLEDQDVRNENPTIDSGEPANRNFNPLSLSAGFIRHLGEDSHLSITLARAERAPTAQELFAFGPHVASQTFEIGQPLLTNESNLHLEAAYRIHGGRLTGTVAVYADRFDDFIYQSNSGAEADGLPVRLWSQQDAEFSGAEAELRYDFGLHRSGHWQLFGLFDMVRGELDDGSDVPLLPPLRFGAGVDWDRGDWAATVTWIHADDQTRVAEYETPTPGYDLLNAELSWHLPRPAGADLELFLQGRNLLDEDIRNSTSYLKDQAPQIGRNFVLGLRAAF
jgi:iron complex outermembrane receptor protein